MLPRHARTLLFISPQFVVFCVQIFPNVSPFSKGLQKQDQVNNANSGQGGQVVRRSGGRLSGGQVVRWSGGKSGQGGYPGWFVRVPPYEISVFLVNYFFFSAKRDNFMG